MKRVKMQNRFMSFVISGSHWVCTSARALWSVNCSYNNLVCFMQFMSSRAQSTANFYCFVCCFLERRLRKLSIPPQKKIFFLLLIFSAADAEPQKEQLHLFEQLKVVWIFLSFARVSCSLLIWALKSFMSIFFGVLLLSTL